MSSQKEPGPITGLTDLMERSEMIVRDMFTHPEIVEDDCITPVWSLLTEEGKVVVLMTPFSNANEKNAVAEIIKKKIEEVKAVAYTFVSETWIVVLDTKDKEQARKIAEETIAPSDHPDRVDAVMIMGEDLYGKSFSWEIRIKDDRVLDTETRKHSAEAVGRFANMFGERKVSPN